MDIIEKLSERWSGIDYPFLIHANGSLKFDEVAKQQLVNLADVKSGDVVALIGDFNSQSILTLLQLIDKNVILVPLTVDTRTQHEYFFESALVDVVIEGDEVKRLNHSQRHFAMFDFPHVKRTATIRGFRGVSKIVFTVCTNRCHTIATIIV